MRRLWGLGFRVLEVLFELRCKGSILAVLLVCCDVRV